MKNYQYDYEEEGVDVDEKEKEEEPWEHQCTCGNYCYNCLGMTWRDFL